MEQKPEETKPPESAPAAASPPENSESLEREDNVVQTAGQNQAEKTVEGAVDTTHGAEIKKKQRSLKGIGRIMGFNIYLLTFILLLVLVSVLTFVSYQKNKKEEAKKEALLTEPLSEETLNKLKQSDVRVGDPKQILSIESNAIFSGKVLVRDSLEVAGQLKIGGPLNLPGINVSGPSNFDQIKAKGLEISGNTSIQGQLAVQSSLTVGGSLSVSGVLNVSNLSVSNLLLNGDLQLNRHIDAGGGTPGKSDGGALGAGGTTSVSGTDTAGTVNISTGGGSGAGCYVTINFAQKFGSTPHVVITPVGGAAGGLNYYINRNNSGFSICTTNGAGGGQSFAFDYIVID